MRSAADDDTTVRITAISPAVERFVGTRCAHQSSLTGTGQSMPPLYDAPKGARPAR
jgi:hypothetical protein